MGAQISRARPEVHPYVQGACFAKGAAVPAGGNACLTGALSVSRETAPA